MSNLPIQNQSISSEKTPPDLSPKVTHVMTPVCIHCHRKISGKDGLFYCVGDPYYGVIHKECAPFYQYLGLWPHSQHYLYYLTKSLRPHPGKTPSPGTL